MRKFIIIPMLLFLASAVYADLSVSWIPEPREYFEIEVFDASGKELMTDTDSVILSWKDGNTASATIEVRWAIVSKSGAAVYIQPIGEFRGSNNSKASWKVHKDGAQESVSSDNPGLGLKIFDHDPGISFISNRIYGENPIGDKIVLEADLSGLSYPINYDDTKLKVYIWSEE